MVAKLAVIIIAIGAAVGALLVNRQQRIDAVAEIARSQLRMEEHHKTITRLQAAVADAVRPSELRVAIGRLSVERSVEWEAIPNRFDPLQRVPANSPEKARLSGKNRSASSSSSAQSSRERGG